MKKIVDFIIYSNLFIALCCSALTLQTALIFEEISKVNFEYVLVNFIATFCLYNFQRLYYSATQTENTKYVWYVKNRRLLFTLIALSIITSFNFLWEFFIENKTHLIVYSLLSIISLIYFLPPIQLKKYGILKPFLISVVFVFIAILIPLNFKFTEKTVFYALAEFFFIAALCLLFDIRDIQADKERGIHTIPVLAGLKKTKLIAITFLCFYIVSLFVLKKEELIIPALLIFCATVVIIIATNEKRNNYFYLCLVDGLLLLQFIAISFFTKN